MPDWSRRRALHALATGATAALAGCSSESGFSQESTPGRNRRTPVTDYTSRTVRDQDGDAIFWTGERPTNSRRARRDQEYLTSADEVSKVHFAPDSEAAADLRQFVEATDFETQSVSLRTTGIPECYTLRLLSVAREPDGYTTSYCYEPRPADVACAAEVHDTVAIAIRLPFAGDEFNSHGSSWSRACRERPYPVTPANENENETTEVGDDA